MRNNAQEEKSGNEGGEERTVQKTVRHLIAAGELNLTEADAAFEKMMENVKIAKGS